VGLQPATSQSHQSRSLARSASRRPADGDYRPNSDVRAERLWRPKCAMSGSWYGLGSWRLARSRPMHWWTPH